MHDIEKHQGMHMPSNDAKITVRMPREVHQSLVEMADKDRRSVNAQILVILERAAQEHQNLRSGGQKTSN
jgi:predicted HicB family RNase H-like nuclease